MGLSGVCEDVVVGAGWVVVVKEGNVGDCVRGVVVGPVGKESAVRTCRGRSPRRSCERHQGSRKLDRARLGSVAAVEGSMWATLVLGKGVVVCAGQTVDM